MAEGQKGGKKNRKHGRNKNSHAMKAYNHENRCEKNKKRRARRHAARMRDQEARIYERWGTGKKVRSYQARRLTERFGAFDGAAANWSAAR
jgi:hypothetical protein